MPSHPFDYAGYTDKLCPDCGATVEAPVPDEPVLCDLCLQKRLARFLAETQRQT